MTTTVEMNSAVLREAYGAEMPGQQLLINDDDLIMRKTKFKPIDAAFDFHAIPYWWMNIYKPASYAADDRTPYDVYSTWSNAAIKYFNYVQPSGYRCESGQAAPRLGARKSHSLDRHMVELREWLQYVIPTKNDDRGSDRLAKNVGIFERTLSAHGCYSLSVFSDEEITLGILRYGSYSTLKTFTDLSSAVDYVRENHYYQKK